jgi:hypothetical protein
MHQVTFSNPQSSKEVSSSRPSSTPSVVKACWGFMAEGTCRKGSSCKFSHDAKLLAASRKQQVSNAVTIDSGLLTHGVGGNISKHSFSKSVTVDSGLLTHCGGCSHCVGGNISSQSCSNSVDSGLVTHCGGCSHCVGGNNNIRTCFDSVSVDSDFPSSIEGGIRSSSTLSSVRDTAPSEPQVFFRERSQN